MENGAYDEGVHLDLSLFFCFSPGSAIPQGEVKRNRSIKYNATIFIRKIKEAGLPVPKFFFRALLYTDYLHKNQFYFIEKRRIAEPDFPG